jgi:hypothetical protein
LRIEYSIGSPGSSLQVYGGIKVLGEKRLILQFFGLEKEPGDPGDALTKLKK